VLELNETIRDNLGREYGDETGREILDAAQSSYHFRNPQSQTSAEAYELLENGHIDQAIELLGEHPWVIGRPRALG